MVYAVTGPCTACVTLLLGAGVDINKAYHHQLTALMWAAGSGSAGAVKLLMSRGANADLKDDRGKTALDIAHEAGNKEVEALLAKDNG